MRVRVGLLLVVCLGMLVPAGGAQGAAPKPLKLDMSNYRYCAAAPCHPMEAGYYRDDNGPATGDNPIATYEVKRGATVIWTYKDQACDQMGCSGHNVVLETGKPAGKKVGTVPSNKGPKQIKLKITQKAGTTIRYFCTISNHYDFGMTGVLKVT